MADCKKSEEDVVLTERLFGDGEQPFVCVICMENYNTPRYLPTCGHTFCEHCLFTYVTNIQQQGSKQECPVCRKHFNLPPDSEVTLEWVQTLPLNTAIIKMNPSTQEKTTEMEETQRECDPCKERGEKVTGVKFCLDCHETYCQACTDNHQSFKALKSHTLVATTEMSAMSNQSCEFFSTFTKCSSHTDRELELYCKLHDVFVCSVCTAIGDHRSCHVFEISGKNPDNAELRKHAEQLTLQMRSVLDHLTMLQNVRKETNNSLKTKLKEIRAAAEHAREQIVKLMDDVVNHVRAATKQIEVTNEDRHHEDTYRVAKLKEMTTEKLGLLDVIEKNGMERHRIICANSLKKVFEDLDGQIFEEDRCMKKEDAELKIADDIRKLIDRSDVENLMEVEVCESDIELKYYDGVSNYQYLQDWQLVRVKGAHIVRPNGKCNPWFEGMAVHNDGRIILSDERGYMCLYNSAKRQTLTLTQKASWSATSINEAHIAVSFPSDKTICIVKVGDEPVVEKILKTQTEPKTLVTLKNGHLAVSWDEPPSFSIIDISGGEIVQLSHMDQDKHGRKFKSFHYFAVDEKRQHVIQSCREDNAVYCFDYAGEPVFKYTDPRLRGPRGVALDRCGNIYVCAWNTNCIHRLSQLGERISIVTEGVPVQPRIICCDRSGLGFWVTQTSAQDKLLYFKLVQKSDT